MSDDDKTGHPNAALVRRAFERSGRVREPRIDGLIEAVPTMMAEAHRRRRLAATPAARISIAAWSWLPRMAATAALLVAIALLWPARSRETASTTADAASSLESWVVTGSSPSNVQDPVLEALVR